MAGQTVQPIAKTIWNLVATQHGVVARWQLLESGLSRSAIDRRLVRGQLHPVFRGVYAVGRPQLTQAGWWMAAVLARGPGAALSHSSGAALWSIGKTRRLIEVSVPASRRARHRGIIVHRRALSNGEVTSQLGIPVIAVVPTLIDLATQLNRDALEAAISEADKRGLVDPETLRMALEGFANRPGVRALRKTLDRRTFRATDSQLERWFLAVVRKTDLPLPETRRFANEARVDFYWPELGLIVETDGLRYHRTPAQQAKDRVRDQRHLAAGLTPLRFTYEQVRYEPDYVQATLESVVAHLRMLQDSAHAVAHLPRAGGDLHSSGRARSRARQ
jgi:very-short-patch-repair endonuclease